MYIRTTILLVFVSYFCFAVAVDEAFQAAKEIAKILRKASANDDPALDLSVFHSTFSATRCEIPTTYENLKKENSTSGLLLDYYYTIRDPVITGDVLKFIIDQGTLEGGLKVSLEAKKEGTKFKITTYTILNKACYEGYEDPAYDTPVNPYDYRWLYY